MKLAGVIAALLAAVGSGCGDMARSGRTPAQVVIVALEGASGATPDEFGSTLSSDVVTIVQRTVDDQQIGVPTIFADNGRVIMRLILRDVGSGPTPVTPSALNQITFGRYRVVYRRADGRNTPGVDVPHPFDSASTFTVPVDGESTVAFTLVRVTAKQEAPLAALNGSSVFIATIAEVTFYGHDQAGNEIAVVGAIGVNFGNFGDPQ